MNALDDKHYFGDAINISKGRLINSKIIFDIVYNPDGTFKKFKARLVARGDQLLQLDPNKFAATVKSETLRILLAIVAEYDLDYDSLYVKTSFSSSDEGMDETPLDLTDAHMPPIAELNKALYGLPKASQYFEEFLSQALWKLGFVRTFSDQQSFVLRKDTAICYVSTHVDDLFVTCTKGSKLNDWVRDQLSLVFQLSYLNPLFTLVSFSLVIYLVNL
jgi:hypothetical protein